MDKETRKETREKVLDLIEHGTVSELQELCKSNDYALTLVITHAMTMRETLTHIKNII